MNFPHLTSQGSLFSMLSSLTSVHCSGGGALCIIRAGLVTPNPAVDPSDTREAGELRESPIVCTGSSQFEFLHAVSNGNSLFLERTYRLVSIVISLNAPTDVIVRSRSQTTNSGRGGLGTRLGNSI